MFIFNYREARPKSFSYVWVEKKITVYFPCNCVCSFQRILKLFMLVDLRDFIFGKKEEKKTEENLFLGDFLVFLVYYLVQDKTG